MRFFMSNQDNLIENNTTMKFNEKENILSNQKIYIEVLKKEYDLELAKKQSLETRQVLFLLL